MGHLLSIMASSTGMLLAATAVFAITVSCMIMMLQTKMKMVKLEKPVMETGRAKGRMAIGNTDYGNKVLCSVTTAPGQKAE